MRFVMFYHSLVSDWNHGNAHFLRGIASELISRGHEVRIYEEENCWSVHNLKAFHGSAPIEEFHRFFPDLSSIEYDRERLDLHRALEGADVVLVHEWSSPRLVARIGEYHSQTGDFLLFFHDTHHRAVTAPHEISSFDLSGYDGVLAFGESLAETYRKSGWAREVWSWHEAADTRVFKSLRQSSARQNYEGDLVWIGNWGDEERTEEVRRFLLDPVKQLGIRACVYGVRYPESALRELTAAGIEYRGWLPNFMVPEVFSRFRATIHVPRRPYVEALPGIPTIRVFEALACGIPLISAFWPDKENLFSPGLDYLVARDSSEMTEHLRQLFANPKRAARISDHGARTIAERHTCGHRINELLAICARARAISHEVVA